ncbi:E3 ubiquitin-protein ligase TRIM56-like [Anneissia japonica]|uniref:E3 ubiquitin-protein ligase TRIM56-like n=1 Tax=Anneissia japonica TaxID=1529436 RepID=UPI0014259FD1|nr:E3 ubiquitin-protein ligase TRIM56-like [Anneissia japonica]
MQLWEIHSSGKLIKDLANILFPVEHQQEFIDEWMTYIDENEYKAVLSKLTGKGFYSQMATSKLNQFLENVDEKVLECTICFKRLKNPKSLTCLHSFCLACLEDWVKVNGELTCPTCSKSYPIPKGGLQNLPPNTFLNNLLETMEQISEKDQMKCVCGKEGQVKYYCKDCKQYLCSTCSDHHTNYRLFANHKLYLMEDVQSMSPSEMTLLHPPQCSHHSKPLEFYCTDCKTPICVHCILMDHNAWDGKHKSINISDAFQTFKETSATLEKSAQHFFNKLEDGLKAVIQNATKLDQMIKAQQ